MAKKSKDAYGALSQTNLLGFDPEDLVIVTDPKSPLYDPRIEDPLTEEFILNIKTHGVIQPIAVWKNPETGKTEVVFGRRRTRGCIEANKRRQAEGLPALQVPAVVRRGSAEQMAAAMVIENENREDDTPLRRGQKMARLLTYGYGEADVANIFGCTVQTVKRILALLEQPAAVRNAVERGQLTIEAAGKLQKLDPEQQRQKVDEAIKESFGKTGHAKSRTIRKVVGARPRLRKRKEIEAMIGNTTGDVARALQWVLGAEAKFPFDLASQSQESA